MSRTRILSLMVGTAVVVSGLTGVVATANADPPSEAEGISESADNSKITFYYGLDRKDGKAKQALKKVSDPKSSSYRQFWSVSKLKKKFGPKSGALKGLKKSAKPAGLKVNLDSSGVFARVTGTVQKMEAWIQGPIVSSTSGGYTVWRAEGSGLAPGLGKFVADPVAIYQAQTGVASTRAQPSKNKGTWIGGCDGAKKTGAYSFNQLNKAYGRLSKSNNKKIGRKTRLAILSAGDGFSDEHLAVSATCFNKKGRTFNRVATDGMVDPLPSIAGEGDLDTQTAQGVLPKGSKVDYIELPYVNLTSASLWFLLYAKIMDLDPVPDVATMSYGYCEPKFVQNIGKVPLKIMDSLLVRLGLVGTSTMASSGDSGSSGCQQFYGTAELSVALPSSSPFTTAVGGSRIVLNADNTRKREVVWNDSVGAGGGGKSTIFPKPWYQSKTGTKKRAVPDLSAMAATYPGYPLYTALGDNPEGWTQIGGTSAASPFLASHVAIMNARETRARRPPLGFLNPAWYAMSKSTRYDIRKGNNGKYNNKCCQAKKGFDLASGLGAPNLRSMYQAFPYEVKASK